MAKGDVIIDMKNIIKRYFIGQPNELEVLHGIDIQVHEGEFVAIVGQSGSGKSTLMNVIGALDRPTEGEYMLDGVDMFSAPDDMLSDIRCRKIGFVFQTYNLIARTSALKNVELPMLYSNMPRGLRNKRAKELLTMMEMADRMRHTPDELSGGQKQRVAIARAMANDPAIILADEPTGALDSNTSVQIMDLLKKVSKNKLTPKRREEILNTGLTTVATYMLQGSVGLVITIIAALFIKDFLPGSGALLALGYGQGTGQAMNYGSIYEYTYGFEGGTSFGLAIAAMGFLSAAIGGVIHLNVSKRRGRLDISVIKERRVKNEEIEGENEIPMQESIDKVTIQLGLIFICYLMTFLVMWGLSKLIPGVRSILYGFNFLFGVIMAVVLKKIIDVLMKKKVIEKEYRNNFLLTRCSNFFFDIMVCAGIAAISIDKIKNYIGVLLILGAVGLVITYIYTKFVCKKLFPDYFQEQFMVMYGMLTGTASTGVILLREIDPEYSTPAADNLVYQNIPAIIVGFPMMFFATIAATKPVLVVILVAVYFVLLNIALFRKQIFKKKKTSSGSDE